MRLLPTGEERALLRESVRGFLAAHWPVADAVRNAVDAAALNAPGKMSISFNDTTGDSVTQDPNGASIKRTFYDPVAYPQFPKWQGKILPKTIEYTVCPTCSPVPAPLIRSFMYDSEGRISSQTNANNITRTFTYTADGRNLLASTTDASGTAVMRTVSTTWDAVMPLPQLVTTGLARSIPALAKAAVMPALCL